MKLKELIQRISVQRKEDHPFPEDLDSYLEDFVPNVLLKSETLQEAFEVTGREMEELYKEGFDHYQTDRYTDSGTVFRWLVTLNPFMIKYWMGLAASQQLLNQDEKALHSYAVAAFLDPESPMPHYHAYECYESLNNKEDAKKALDLAYKRCLSNAEYEHMKPEIESKR